MMEGQKTFLDNAKLGRAKWWAYAAGWTVLIVPNAVIQLALYIAILRFAGGFDALKYRLPKGGQEWEQLGIDPLINYVAMNATFLVGIALMWVIVRFIHRRPFVTLLSGRGNFDFDRAILGFVVWFVLSLIAGGINWAFFPEEITISYSARRFLHALPLMAICTPVQCFCEELIFRGYLVQTCALRTRNFWVLVAINGFLFAAPHMRNPGADSNPLLVFLGYLVIGLMLTIFTLRSNGIETAVGVHTANNFFLAAILNNTVTPLDTPSIFLGHNLHPLLDLVTLAAMSVISYLIFDRYERSRQM